MKRPRREQIRVPGLPSPVSHYADAVRYGDLVFVSGLCGVHADGTLVGDDAGSQARQALSLLGKVLDAVGATPANVIKVTVYLTDVTDREAVNAERRAFFGDAYPASTLIGVVSLVAATLKVEIEAVVGLPE